MDQNIRTEAEMDYRAALADAGERVRIQASIADTGMKALLLVNGGAMIALFTFLGAVVSRTSGPAVVDTRSIWWAFTWFVVGLVFALLCHVLAFLSQDRFYNQAMHEAWRHQSILAGAEKRAPDEAEARHFTIGIRLYAAAIAASTVSVIAFATGCGCALSGFLLS